MVNPCRLQKLHFHSLFEANATKTKPQIRLQRRRAPSAWAAIFEMPVTSSVKRGRFVTNNKVAKVCFRNTISVSLWSGITVIIAINPFQTTSRTDGSTWKVDSINQMRSSIIWISKVKDFNWLNIGWRVSFLCTNQRDLFTVETNGICSLCKPMGFAQFGPELN